MKNWTKKMVLIAGSMMVLRCSLATTFLEFDSSYLGDGWFQYRMQVMNDPFFSAVTIPQLYFHFTNQIDGTASSSDWTNSSDGGSVSDWYSDLNNPSRPYQNVFLMRSAQTSYRLASFDHTNSAATAILELSYRDFAPYYISGQASVFGYANLPGLIPCDPEAADGSPTNYSFALKLLPDISIQQLFQSNGVVNGIKFSWDYESTLLLQGSADMKSWTNIAYLWSYPPETTWTTNISLTAFGNFFRVELVANGQGTNLPPLNMAGVQNRSVKEKNSLVIAATSRVLGCQVAQGRIAVSVATQPNQSYVVKAVDSHQRVQATQTITATGSSAVAYFDAAGLAAQIYFQVAAAP
jgi:hypothetical protein